MTKTETYVEDGIEYTKSNGRMRYNPEFHENHGKPFKTSELSYMCAMWKVMKKPDIAMALGRTVGTVLSKMYHIKKSGQFEQFKNIGQ